VGHGDWLSKLKIFKIVVQFCKIIKKYIKIQRKETEESQTMRCLAGPVECLDLAALGMSRVALASPQPHGLISGRTLRASGV
jgi:hypothetical protein